MADLIAVFVQFVIHIKDRSPRVSEYGIYPLFFQTLYYYLSSI